MKIVAGKMGIDIHEVIDTARQVSGCDIPVKTGPRRPGDPRRLIGDAARIRQDFGWIPPSAALDAIIRTAWNWHQKS